MISPEFLIDLRMKESIDASDHDGYDQSDINIIPNPIEEVMPLKVGMLDREEVFVMEDDFLLRKELRKEL